MLAQGESALPLQLETDQAVWPQDVASGRSPRLLWTGLGFAALMVMGVSACALHPTQTPSAHVPALAAFNPTSPALQPRLRSAKTAGGFVPVYEGGLQGIDAQGGLQNRYPAPEAFHIAQSKIGTSRLAEPKMSMADMPVVAKVSETLAAVDSGTSGLDGNTGAYLAVAVGFFVILIGSVVLGAIFIGVKNQQRA